MTRGSILSRADLARARELFADSCRMSRAPYSAIFIGTGEFNDPVIVCAVRADGWLWCMADYGNFWAAPHEVQS